MQQEGVNNAKNIESELKKDKERFSTSRNKSNLFGLNVQLVRSFLATSQLIALEHALDLLNHLHVLLLAQLKLAFLGWRRACRTCTWASMK